MDSFNFKYSTYLFQKSFIFCLKTFNSFFSGSSIELLVYIHAFQSICLLEIFFGLLLIPYLEFRVTGIPTVENAVQITQGVKGAQMNGKSMRKSPK